MVEFKLIPRKSVSASEWSKLEQLGASLGHCITSSKPGRVEQIAVSWDSRSSSFNKRFLVLFVSTSNAPVAVVREIHSSVQTGSKPWMLLLATATKLACPKAKAIRFDSSAQSICKLHRAGFVICKASRTLSFTEPEAVKKALQEVSPRQCYATFDRACMDINVMFLLQAIIDSKLVPELSYSISTLAEHGIPMFYKLQ